MRNLLIGAVLLFGICGKVWATTDCDSYLTCKSECLAQSSFGDWAKQTVQACSMMLSYQIEEIKIPEKKAN